MSDIELAVADSLKRQIKEVKKQIEQARHKNMAKFLEVRRKTDQRKARLVLITLKLKKQYHDCQTFLLESRKQWSSELAHSYELIMKYIDFLHEEKEYREGLLTQLVSMISFGPIENLNDENSSEEETIEQECSTDIMYLSANLRAAIEGSTMDRLSSRDILSLKFSCITKDLRKYMGKLKTLDFENEYQKFANLPVAEPILQEEAKVLEVKEQEIKHHSAFSFSSPEKKSIHISPIKANQEPSLSSEWEISSEIIEQDENSKDESGKWNSISVISLHSVSNSSSSEACESVELLHKPPVMQGTQTEFKKKSCWRRFFCCFKS